MNTKKVLVGMFGSLFVGFFLLSPGGVMMALAQIATSTPTFIPPSVTPTSLEFTCPVGTPAGWGTYTPSALWQLECSSCASVVTPTVPADTVTPDPTQYSVQTTQQAICQTAVASGGVTPEACGSFPIATVTPTAFVTGTAPVTCSGSLPTVMPTNSAIPSSWLIVQETGLIYSGSWTLGACASCSGGNEKYSNVVGDYFTYTANTTGFRFVQKIKDNYGVAKIYIDGNFITNVDLYSASLLYQQVVYEITNLPYGSHTLKVEVLGQKQSSSSNYWVGVDYVSYYSIPSTQVLAGIACNPGAGDCVSDGTHATVTYSGSATAIGNYFSLSPAGVPLQVTVSVTMTHAESSGYSANGVYDSLSIVQSVQGAVYQDSQWCVGVAGTYSTCSATHTGVYTVTPNAGDARFYVGTTQAADYPSSSTMTYTIDVWIGVQCMTTPTPSVTSTPYFDTGFCSSVSPTIDEFGFDLFIPDGAPNCNMGWEAFGVGVYTVPAVQICFQPSQFGVIRLFGEDYEVGVYGLAAAAAFLWRYFRTV
ncbi:MAG: hypothetical protein HYZ22_02185 [Chloroflexi bacterium]|nr:hypothetical protein [Chloroflexota bacterium]